MQHRRSHIPSLSENCNYGDRRHGQCKTNQQLRAPFTVLIQNIHNVNNLQDQHTVNITKDVPRNGKPSEIKKINKFGTWLDGHEKPYKQSLSIWPTKCGPICFFENLVCCEACDYLFSSIKLEVEFNHALTFIYQQHKLTSFKVHFSRRMIQR